MPMPNLWVMLEKVTSRPKIFRMVTIKAVAQTTKTEISVIRGTNEITNNPNTKTNNPNNTIIKANSNHKTNPNPKSNNQCRKCCRVTFVRVKKRKNSLNNNFKPSKPLSRINKLQF